MLLKKDVYNAEIKNIKNKISDISNLATNTTLNCNLLNDLLNEVKNEIPSITKLVTNSSVHP